MPGLTAYTCTCGDTALCAEVKSHGALLAEAGDVPGEMQEAMVKLAAPRRCRESRSRALPSLHHAVLGRRPAACLQTSCG